MSTDPINPPEISEKAVAFYGGSFDPIHLGHLIVAQDALEYFGLEKVYFIPAAQNPLKNNAPIASAEARLAMIRAAVTGDNRFGVLDVEQRLPLPSYTLQTVEALRGRFPTTQRLFWIIGSDQLPSLHRWHRIETLVQKVEFICVERPGESTALPAIPGLRCHPLRAHRVEISSTEIRERAHRGMPIDFYLHPEVLLYINDLRLYTR